MKPLLLFLLLIPVGIFAQTTTLTGIQYDHPYAGVYDMGKKGVAIMGGLTSSKTERIVRIDTKGKLMWNKEFKIPSTAKYMQNYFSTSADGNDIYILSFENSSSKAGYSGAILTYVDSTGKGNSKRYDDYKDAFGHVLAMFANSKYFFVYVSTKDYNTASTTKNLYKIYRFDKKTMEMKLLDDDLLNVNPEFKSAWQMIRVTDNGVTAYRVMTAQDHTITIELADFDNDGKKISYKTNDITLTSFPRSVLCKPYYSAGVCQGEYVMNATSGQTFALFPMEPDAWCNMVYDDVNDRFIAFGITGPSKQRGVGSQMGAIFDGFFIQQISTDFSLGKLVENNGISELDADKKLSRDDAPTDRKMAFHLNPNGEFLLNFISFDSKKHVFVIDGNTFKIIRHSIGENIHSMYNAEPEANIIYASDVQKYYATYPGQKSMTIQSNEFDDVLMQPLSFDTRYGQLLIFQDLKTNALTCFWTEKMDQ